MPKWPFGVNNLNSGIGRRLLKLDIFSDPNLFHSTHCCFHHGNLVLGKNIGLTHIYIDDTCLVVIDDNSFFRNSCMLLT